jgi:type II secretory ATPase GspE/PulE/Tfp pilus assembly ATPase PilB-like protein
VAIAREVIARVPRAMAEKYRCVPLRIQGAELHIGMADPQNFQQLDELSFALAARLRPYVITEATLDTALEQYYGIRKAARLMQVATGGLMDFDGGNGGGLMPDLAPAPLPVFDTLPVQPLAPPVPSARPSAVMNVFDQLAAVMSDQDVVDSLFRYFSELFDEVIVLAVREDRPVPVRAGNRLLHRQARHATSFSLAEGTLLRAVLAKPQIIHLPEVNDREMVQLCASYNIACAQLAFISLFNDNRPAYVVAGQGRDHAYLKEAFSGLKRYVSKVAHALRIVALRNEIRAA